MVAMFRLSPRAASLILILAVLKAGCNTNTKYVKGSVRAAALCDLDSLLALRSDDGVVDERLREARTVDDHNLMVLQELFGAAAVEEAPSEAVESVEKRPGAVVRGLERSLVGDGAHREVHSEVLVDVDLADDASKLSVSDDCELILLEQLSAGVFADPFQLHRLQQQEAVKLAHIYGDVDLERPAKASFSSIVELRQRLVPAKTDKLEVLYHSKVVLPLHARYPPTSPASHYLLNFTLPHLLVSCGKGKGSATRDIGTSKLRLCIYGKLSGDALKRASFQLLQWSIPSGYPNHLWAGKLTTLASLAGVALIFLVCKFSAWTSGPRK